MLDKFWYIEDISTCCRFLQWESCVCGQADHDCEIYQHYKCQ